MLEAAFLPVLLGPWLGMGSEETYRHETYSCISFEEVLLTFLPYRPDLITPMDSIDLFHRSNADGEGGVRRI